MKAGIGFAEKDQSEISFFLWNPAKTGFTIKKFSDPSLNASEQDHVRFSKMPAAPCPPPIHIVTRPYLPLRRFNSCMS